MSLSNASFHSNRLTMFLLKVQEYKCVTLYHSIDYSLKIRDFLWNCNAYSANLVSLRLAPSGGQMYVVYFTDDPRRHDRKRQRASKITLKRILSGFIQTYWNVRNINIKPMKVTPRWDIKSSADWNLIDYWSGNTKGRSWCWNRPPQTREWKKRNHLIKPHNLSLLLRQIKELTKSSVF